MRTLRLLLILCILPFLSVEAQNSNYYVTPTGAGDGSAWTKSLNAKSFVSKFSDETYQTDTFHLSEGKYLLNAKEPQPLMTNVKGGYVADDYTVRDPFNNESVISGSVSTKENECVTVQVTVPTEAEITLDGVVLESAAAEPVIVSSAGEGSAVILKGCVLRKAAPNVCEDQVVKIDTTIYLGMAIKELPDAKFEKIGRFIEEVTSEGENGCNLITQYVVSVLPKSDGKLNYYVKQNGTGDGSSWENAMGDTAFAYAFGRVEEGATFHVAEGVYRPIYDKNGEELGSGEGEVSQKVFYSNKTVNIIGGYPADANDKSVPDTLYHTVFSGFIPLGSGYTIGSIMQLEPTNAGSVHISGVRFERILSMNSEQDAALKISAQTPGVTWKLDSCRFEKLKGSPLHVSDCGGKINMCDFGCEPGSGIDYWVSFSGTSTDALIIENSSLNCDVKVLGNTYTIANSSIKRITIGSVTGTVVSSKGTIDHSTIDSLLVSPNSECELNGNIVAMVSHAKAVVSGDSNIFIVGEITHVVNVNDKTLSAADFASLFESGVMSMAYNSKSFTRTYALVSDTLPDGTSIRIPRGTILTDQIGKDRALNTCPGAYELAGYTKEIYSDEVLVYTVSDTYPQIGETELIKEEKQDDGNTYNVHYKVNVLPNPAGETLNYYVKQNGTGDGSSWANAMGDTAFAFAFGKVPSGATFHVAEGVYHPVYDKNGKYDFSTNQALMDRVFHTEKLVSVIGGYSNNAEEFPVADTSYHTIFSAAITESISANGVMRIEPQQSGEVHISGVRFIDTLTSIYKCKDLLTIDPKSNGVTFRLDSCRFTGDAIRLLNVDSCGGKISMCDFVSLGDGKEKSKVDISGLSSDSLIVNNTSLSCQINVGYYPYYIANSTIDKIVFETNSESNVTKGSIENSTILDLTYYPNTEGILQGNIIYSYVKVKAPITLSNNIVVVNDDDVVEDQDNMYVTREEVNSLWGGESPTMTYPDNSFTQTVKLLKDTLPNGKPIRINRTLSLDQIGQTRLDATCPGAYEIGFFQRIIELSDTAMALDSCKFSYVLNSSKSALKSWTKSKDGEAYDFAFDLHDAKILVAGGTERFVKPGDLYVWRDTIKHDESDVMYDTIFVRKISVLPKPSPKFMESNELHYYVKVDGSGNGDGSSWENAMSNESFDFAIDTVTNGATFHIAAGTYTPISKVQNMGNYYPSYTTSKAVNLMGGYVENPNEDAEANPCTDSTTVYFSGDKESYDILHYSLNNDASITISGIEFVQGVCYYDPSYSLSVSAEDDVKVSALIDKCVFTTSHFGLYVDNISADVRDCIFERDTNNIQTKELLTPLYVAGKSNIRVSSSLFDENPRLTNVSGAGTVNFTNCTFVNNSYAGNDATVLLSGDDVTLLNNTFFNPVSIHNAEKVTLYGNVFAVSLEMDKVGDVVCMKNIIRRFNPLDYNTLEMEPDGEVRFFISDDDKEKIFQYDGGSPKLADNGGFTRTVAMISDRWNDFELRVPQELTNVSFDQRGEKRFQMACIGAYEMSEYIHREPLADTTIVVGNPVTVGGASYDKIGEYVWKDTIVNPDGSQTAYSRNVVVMPKAGENLYYYVKQNGDGTGDGSSWSNAMSDSAFAFAFSRVEDGATFHIAEGTYHPIYNHSGDISENETDHIYIERDFYTTHLVNLVGGYPSQPDENSLPDTKYHTVLSGADATASGIIRSRNVIYMEPEKAGTIKLSGIRFAESSKFQFDDTNASLYVDPKVKGVHVDLDKCRFEAIGNLMKMDSCSTTITECNFVSENRVIIDGDASDSLIISNSSFDCPLEVKANGYKIVNSTIDSLYIGGKKETSLSNGELIHNTILSLHYNTQWTSTLTNNIVCHISQTEEGVLKGDHNLIRNDEELNISNVGLYVTMNDLLDLLNNDQGQFIMSYADGSFTRTIALLKDSVAGQSIRSPRLADVKNDQNGRARYDETCAGAFELPGMMITVQGKDTTISVHESIGGIAFDQIGVHQHCTTTIQTDESKMVTCRNVIVLPKSDESLHYYVSQRGEGLADGSSWENAMSDSSFAFAFGKVPSDAVFYVNSGTYYPFRMDGEEGLSPDGFLSDRTVSVVAKEDLSNDELPCLSNCMVKDGVTYTVPSLLSVQVNSMGKSLFHRVKFSCGSGKEVNAAINFKSTNGSVGLSGCRFTDFDTLYVNTDCVSRVDSCDFSLNGKYVSFDSPNNKSLNIYRSSFDCIVYMKCLKNEIVNSSFYSLETLMPLSEVRIKHNTIYKLVFRAGNISLYRNLVADFAVLQEFVESNGTFTSHENMIQKSAPSNLKFDPTDMEVPGFFSQLGCEDYTMQYNGKFTKSFIMLRDTLLDGTSIRVELKDALSSELKSPDKDQFGVSRYDSTCRGAVEYKMNRSLRDIYDTICVSELYRNVRYNEVGEKVLCIEEPNNYGGIDFYTIYLTILPKSAGGKSAPYVYYVKQNGKGNGSSWMEAMSDSAFAVSFGRVRNNSTFHIAAGVYQPLYDQSLHLANTETDIATFYTERWVNIVGGYDADVMDQTAVPNPNGERTIFARSSDWDAVSEESDSIAVLSFAPSTAHTYTISGVTVCGGTSLQVNAKKSGVAFKISNSLMKYGVGVKADKLDSLYLNAVTFDSCQTGVAAGELSYLKAVNSTFAADPNALDGELAISLPSTFNGRCILTHNTLLAPVSVSGGSYYWTGNIFAGGVVACDGSKQGKVDSKYNLYPENASVAQSYDIQNSLTAMEELFGGTWDLDYTLGFTPVLPLASDVLNNGRSIRFKREVSNLSVDQIGESRLFLTCMGAYEYANVTELTIPTAFTPYTKDGINDIFMFGYPVFIYDRYGRLIANSDNGWDGKYRGEDADAGVYVYVLWDANGKQYKGTVEILKQK